MTGLISTPVLKMRIAGDMDVNLPLVQVSGLIGLPTYNFTSGKNRQTPLFPVAHYPRKLDD